MSDDDGGSSSDACSIDFGRVPPAVLPDLKRNGQCRRCKKPIAKHKISLLTSAAEASAGRAASSAGERPVVVFQQTRSSEDRKLDAVRLAQTMTRSVRSSYKHEFGLVPKINLGRSLQHANALHQGIWGCPSIVAGTVPERTTRAAYVRAWERMRYIAVVSEGCAMSLVAAMHTILAVRGAAKAGEFRRDLIFTDATAGAPSHIALEDVPEMIRTLQCLALGLRAGADRDQRVFTARHIKQKMRIPHEVVGNVHPFLYARAKSLDYVCAVLLSMRDGAAAPHPAADSEDALSAEVTALMRAAGLPTTDGPETAAAAAASASATASATAATAASGGGGGGGAGGAASGGRGAQAAAAGTGSPGGRERRPTFVRSPERHGTQVDIAALSRAIPWIGLGAAVATELGQPVRGVTAKAWEALDASEALAMRAVPTVFPSVGAGSGDASSDGSGEGAGADGGGDGGKGGGGGGQELGTSAKRRKRARSKGKGAAPNKDNKPLTAADLQAVVSAALRGAGASTGTAGGGTRPTPTAADRAAAKARVAAKDVDEVTKQDCLDAALCFRCKRDRHGESAPCDLRGRRL